MLAGVAGGVGRRSGPSLTERSQVAAAGSTPAAAGSVAPGPEPSRCRPVITRHCWVSRLPDCPRRFAGVVVEWAEGPPGRSVPGWRGRVVYIVDDGGQAVLVEAWIDAAYLSPAGS